MKRVPFESPPFSLSQVKKAIPVHCFKRSVIKSFSYLIYDLITAFCLYYIATHYFHHLPRSLSFLAWPTYWAIQGCILMGVWVIGHECGHHAFSDYQWLDNTVGLLLHSAILTPYFSFKYTHRRHHSNVGSLEWDEVYVPIKKSSIKWYSKYLNNPPGRLLRITMYLTLGWPQYLTFNAWGRPYERFASHFDPHGPIYSDRERLQIYVSDAGVLLVCYGLYHLVMAKGLAWVLCVYGLPLLVLNGFVVLNTYLHHTHPALPHYDSSEWDWFRGALATVDRDYGSILNKVFHNLSNTHVAHHLFSTMPHYHAVEATKAIKPILGEYYRFDHTPIYKALWRIAGECIYVESDQSGGSKGVFWYNNKP